MARVLSGKAEIQPNHEVRISVPDDMPVGPIEYTLTVPEEQTGKTGTLADFVNSEFFGMWKDRTDIKDSVEFARELREKAWRRSE